MKGAQCAWALAIIIWATAFAFLMLRLSMRPCAPTMHSTGPSPSKPVPEIRSYPRLAVAIAVCAVVQRPCLPALLQSLVRFYQPSQIFLYHNNTALRHAYPQYHHLPRIAQTQTPEFSNTWNDPPDRVRWRSSLVFDYAMMLRSMIGIAEKLITTEDDALHHLNLSTVLAPFSAHTPNKPICSSVPSEDVMSEAAFGDAVTYVLPGDVLSSLSNYLLALWDVKPLGWLVADFFALKSKCQLLLPMMCSEYCTLVTHASCNSTKKILYNIAGR